MESAGQFPSSICENRQLVLHIFVLYLKVDLQYPQKILNSEFKTTEKERVVEGKPTCSPGQTDRQTEYINMIQGFNKENQNYLVISDWYTVEEEEKR